MARPGRRPQLTQELLAPDGVVSHGSAAVLHGLPVWSTGLSRVQVTRAINGGGRRRGPVHLHGAPLPATEVVILDAFRVTSLGRTVVDLARWVPFDQAVTAGDAALRPRA
jgi:hypothetical protein